MCPNDPDATKKLKESENLKVDAGLRDIPNKAY